MTLFVPTNPVQPGQPEDAKQLQDSFAQAADVLNGKLGGDNFPAAGIPDAMQVQPAAPVWQRLHSSYCAIPVGDMPGGTWFIFAEGGSPQSTSSGNSRGRYIAFFHADPAGAQLPKRKTLMRFGVTVAANVATASALDFSFFNVDRGAGFAINDTNLFWTGARPVVSVPILSAGQIYSGFSTELEYSPATFATTPPRNMFAFAVRRTSGATPGATSFVAAEAFFDVRWIES